uniref:SH2 domain-containing protein n=1 Tax=Chrysemys picta bellii TaxID=8478 RepID=A0A8C3IAR2_CHRPI
VVSSVINCIYNAISTMIRGRPDDLLNAHKNLSPPQRQHRRTPHTPAPSSLPTHYRAFRSCEWEVVERSLNILQASGFYWGPLSVSEAHAKLQQEPVGTYLVRDSSQGNCLFSVSVRMPAGPVSLRISFREGYFWLKDWFSDCVVRLLEMVVAGTQELCIKAWEVLEMVLSLPPPAQDYGKTF